jgi:hypothetical protein
VAKTRRLRPGRPLAWAAANSVPLVLVPLAAVLVWVAIWKVWLPQPATGGATARTVTTVDGSTTTAPAHKVTTVVKTTIAAPPSRRSETFAIVLIFLGAGAAVIAVFHDRIGSIELDRTGIKLDLTKAEQSGAAELVARLAGGGAGSGAYAQALGAYVRGIAARRPAAAAPAGAVAGAAAPGLNADQASALAERIADQVV